MNEIKFVKVTDENLYRVKEFYGVVYRHDYPLLNDKFFKWWFKNNPYFIEDGYSVVIIEANKEVIGHLAYWPTVFNFFGDTSLVLAWTGNLIIKEVLRSRGLGYQLVKEVCKNFDIIGAINANDTAVRLLSGLGWHHFGNLNRYVKILNPEGTLELLNNPNQELKDYIGKSVQSTDFSVEGVKPIRKFDIKQDYFWEEQMKPSLICGERTSKYLNWRYADHPIFDYKLLQVYDSNSNCQGFAVYRIEKVMGKEVQVGRLLEFFANKTYSENLLSFIVNEMKNEKCSLVDIFISCKKFDDIFKKNGFKQDIFLNKNVPRLFQPLVHENFEINMLLQCRNSKINLNKFNEIENWYVTSGDCDQDRPN